MREHTTLIGKQRYCYDDIFVFIRFEKLISPLAENRRTHLTMVWDRCNGQLVSTVSQ